MASRHKRYSLPPTRLRPAFALRLGAVFASLALLAQLVVSTLPMRTGTLASWPICAAEQPSKAPRTPHHGPSGDQPCPVCAAIHLGSVTLPAADIAAVQPIFVTWVAAAPVAPSGVRPVRFGPPMARGPPAMVPLETT